MRERMYTSALPLKGFHKTQRRDLISEYETDLQVQNVFVEQVGDFFVVCYNPDNPIDYMTDSDDDD